MLTSFSFLPSSPYLIITLVCSKCLYWRSIVWLSVTGTPLPLENKWRKQPSDYDEGRRHCVSRPCAVVSSKLEGYAGPRGCWWACAIRTGLWHHCWQEFLLLKCTFTHMLSVNKKRMHPLSFPHSHTHTHIHIQIASLIIRSAILQLDNGSWQIVTLYLSVPELFPLCLP